MPLPESEFYRTSMSMNSEGSATDPSCEDSEHTASETFQAPRPTLSKAPSASPFAGLSTENVKRFKIALSSLRCNLDHAKVLLNTFELAADQKMNAEDQLQEDFATVPALSAKKAQKELCKKAEKYRKSLNDVKQASRVIRENSNEFVQAVSTLTEDLKVALTAAQCAQDPELVKVIDRAQRLIDRAKGIKIGLAECFAEAAENRRKVRSTLLRNPSRASMIAMTSQFEEEGDSHLLQRQFFLVSRLLIAISNELLETAGVMSNTFAEARYD